MVGSCSARNLSAMASSWSAIDAIMSWRAVFDLVEAVGRDLFLADVLAVVAVEVVGLLLDEIDDPLEVGLGADRQLDGDGVVAQLLLELVGDARRVGARAVQLVDEREARDVVAAHLPVDGVRLRLHARGAAQHQHGAVEHAQRALDLDGEVDVPGGVDQVDDVAVPLAVGGRRLDGDPLLALEIHRVHLGADAGLAADLLDPVDLARVEEDALRQGRLARVDVRGDADVANFFEWDGGHGCLSSFGVERRGEFNENKDLWPVKPPGEMPAVPDRLRAGYLTPTSSTSNTSVAFGGIGPAAAGAVGQLGRNGQLALAADPHALDAQVPALDDLPRAQQELDGRAARRRSCRTWCRRGSGPV